MKLRKATVEDLKKKCPKIVELLENDLAEIKDIQGLLKYIEEHTIFDLQEKFTKYFSNVNDIYIFNPDNEYLDYFLEDYMDKNINKFKSNYSENLSEGEQIKIFRKVNEFEDDTLNDIMDFLDRFDRDNVLKKLKEYDYID